MWMDLETPILRLSEVSQTMKGNIIWYYLYMEYFLKSIQVNLFAEQK